MHLCWPFIIGLLKTNVNLVTPSKQTLSRPQKSNISQQKYNLFKPVFCLWIYLQTLVFNLTEKVNDIEKDHMYKMYVQKQNKTKTKHEISGDFTFKAFHNMKSGL